MNLLYIDNPSLQTQIRVQNLEDIGKHTVEMANSLGDVYMMFKKDKYDVVIIDHGIENGNRYIEHINEIDPMQRVLTVSSAVRCVYDHCDDCVENHNVRRLNNPTTMKNIMRMVQGFDGFKCDHYDAQTNSFDGQTAPKSNSR
jgi:DNA-binding NtrC family response regulator